MSIELKKEDYIADFWLADSLDDDNLLLMLLRRGSNWLIFFRLRYVGEDGKVSKAFYRKKVPVRLADENAMVANCGRQWHMWGEVFCRRRTHWRVAGNMDKFMEVAKESNLFNLWEEDL